MNRDFFSYNKCLNDLALILSIGYFYNFSSRVVEKRISNSKYFNLFNRDFLDARSYISSSELAKSIFPEVNTDNFNHNLIEFQWVAMMYLYIIDRTDLNFETVFIYIGIESALKMFKIYHEMDLSAAFNRFMELYNEKSIIKSKMLQLGLSNEQVSLQTAISLSMIDALKNRHRDIKKLEVQKAITLSNILNIQIETLLNN